MLILVVKNIMMIDYLILVDEVIVNMYHFIILSNNSIKIIHQLHIFNESLNFHAINLAFIIFFT